MKIVSILGSPRSKANSSLIAERFNKTARELGADLLTFHLNGLKYRGCQACMGCKTTSDKCVLKDDLTEVLEAISETDVLVIASPTYFGEVSGQTKAFIDRTYSYLKNDYRENPNPSRLSEGKQLVFIQTQASPDENLFNDVFPRYEQFFKWFGFKQAFLIRACGVSEPGAVETNTEIMSAAGEIAQKIMAGTYILH